MGLYSEVSLNILKTQKYNIYHADMSVQNKNKQLQIFVRCWVKKIYEDLTVLLGLQANAQIETCMSVCLFACQTF